MNRKQAMLAALLLLVLAGHSFAAGWQVLAGGAIVASACALAIVFMFGEAFGIEEAKTLAREEIYQVAVTVAMLGCFAGLEMIANDVSKGFGDGTATTLQAVAGQKLETMLKDLGAAADSIAGVVSNVAQQSAQSASCSLMGVGLNVNGCGGFGVLLPAASLASTTLATGFAELQALKMLLTLGTKYSFTLLLPVGIFLRTFKFTRGAGGMFLGMAVALYIMLPITLLFFSYMFGDLDSTFGTLPKFTEASCDPYSAGADDGGGAVEMVEDPKRISAYVSGFTFSGGTGTTNEKEEEGTGFTGGGGIEANEANAMAVLMDFSGKAMEYYIYLVLVKVTLTAIIAIMVTVLTIQRVTSIAGAEVDLSALSRVA